MSPNPQFPADLVTFTVEILNGKLHFLCSYSWLLPYCDLRLLFPNLFKFLLSQKTGITPSNIF